MKYLLQAIDARRDCVRLSDHELRDLLIEVRNGKDDKIEFTESMVRLLDELKSSEHATAFLTKVAKRDAPDYYEVIKNPMDLGTMMRNVRQGRYKSKAQFMRDLDLIWDNCLTYNSEPTHPLRRSVQVLRNKANHLLTYVNDTNDVKEALNQWQASLGLRRRPSDVGLGEEASLMGGDKHAASLGVSGERNASLSVSRLPVATLIDTPFEQRPALLRNCDNMSTFERINASQVELDRQFAQQYLYLNEPGPSSQRLRTLDAGAVVNTDVADLDMLKTLEGAQGSVLRMALTTAPKRAPAKNSDDQQMSNGDVTQAEADKEDEIPYPLEDEDAAAGEEEEGGQSSQSALFDTASAWWNSMSHPSMLPAGASHLQNSEQTESKRLKYITGRPSHKRRRPHTADEQPRADGRKLLAGGAEALERNVKTISRLRRTHNKYARLHGHIESGDPIPADLGVVSSDDENDDDEEGAGLANGRRQNGKSTATKESRKLRRKALDTCLLPMGELAGNPFIKLGSEAATDMLQNKTNLLLAHAGFDASQKNASDVVADIAGEYLMNVGRTMRNYVDRFTHEMSVEELILHTLFENGGTDVRALESYVADDVVRYGHKMSELLRKLRASYRDTLAHSDLTMADEAAYFGASQTQFAAGQAGVASADSTARQDGADADEHILRGGYAMELADEDFFGFKDLGLDQELGMDVGRQLATMPSRMFSRRAQEEGAAGQAGMAAKNRFGPGSGESGSSVRYDFEPPAPLIALSEAAVGAQIGLLRGYYRELFRTRGQWQRTGNDDDPTNSQGDAAKGDPTVTQAETTHAPTADEDGIPKDAFVILPDEEQERQRYKVPPTGKMPRRAMKERGTVSSQAQARQTATTTAANGKSSTATNGTGANAARGKAGGATNGGGGSAKNAASMTKGKASNGSSKKKKDAASKAQQSSAAAVTVG